LDLRAASDNQLYAKCAVQILPVYQYLQNRSPVYFVFQKVWQINLLLLSYYYYVFLFTSCTCMWICNLMYDDGGDGVRSINFLAMAVS